MNALEINNVSQWFGSNRVLHEVNLSIKPGSIVSLVGPSGCGKSTLLRAILATHKAKQGSIRVGTRDNGMSGMLEVARPGPDRGIVYQKYSLFPHLTALENVAFGPWMAETSPFDRMVRRIHSHRIRERILDRAREYLDRVHLLDAADRYPGELSGGMQQRVSIAQALIMRPAILLLDEPFGALDEATRESMQNLLLEFADENRRAEAEGEPPPHTVLIVTHELSEALYVADRVVGLSQYWGGWRGTHRKCPGATIVYDKSAPLYKLGDDKPHMAELREQIAEIRAVVMNPENTLLPSDHIVL